MRRLGRGPAGRDRPPPALALALGLSELGGPRLPRGAGGGSLVEYPSPGRSGDSGRGRARLSGLGGVWKRVGASATRAGRKRASGPRRPARAPRHVRRLQREVAASERRRDEGGPGRRPGGGARPGAGPRGLHLRTHGLLPSAGDSEARHDKRLERLWAAAGAS